MEGESGESVEDGLFHDFSIVKVKRVMSPKKHIGIVVICLLSATDPVGDAWPVQHQT